MALSGYTCWIGLGGRGSSQVDRADAGKPKYGSPGAQTTKAMEIYLVDKHRTLYTCRTRTCHVTLGLAAYISRTREAFRAYTTIQRSIPQLIVTCIAAICLIVSYSST